MSGFVIPTTKSFQQIRGRISNGIELRCGSCRCQCVCNCPTVCKNCKHHVDSSFVRAYAAR